MLIGLIDQKLLQNQFYTILHQFDGKMIGGFQQWPIIYVSQEVWY